MMLVAEPHPVEARSGEASDVERSVDPMEARVPNDDSARFTRYIEPEVDFVRRVSSQFSRSRADAEELAQEVLTKAFRGIATFDGRYPRAWLRRIAANTAASRARKKRFDEVALDNDGLGIERAIADTAEAPEVVALADAVDPLIEQAVSGLPEHQRQVIELVDMAGASYSEAARALGVPVGTVMSRLHRARGKLRDTLSGSHLDRARAVDAIAPV